VSRPRNKVGKLVPPQFIAEIQNSLRRQRTGNPGGSLLFPRASVRDDDRKHLLQLTASSSNPTVFRPFTDRISGTGLHDNIGRFGAPLADHRDVPRFVPTG